MTRYLFSALALLLLLLSERTKAQAPGPKGALLISAGTNQPGADYNEFGAFTLEYRRSRSHNRSYRLGVYYGLSGTFTSRTSALGVDSYSVASRQSTWRYFGLSGALETERPFHRKVYMAAGLEARLSYGRQGDVGVSTLYYGPQSPGGNFLPGSSATLPASQQSVGLQGRPYLGARLYIGTRVLLGLDFGPTVDADFVFRRNRSSNVTDLNLSLITGVFRAGFRF